MDVKFCNDSNRLDLALVSVTLECLFTPCRFRYLFRQFGGKQVQNVHGYIDFEGYHAAKLCQD